MKGLNFMSNIDFHCCPTFHQLYTNLRRNLIPCLIPLKNLARKVIGSESEAMLKTIPLLYLESVTE